MSNQKIIITYPAMVIGGSTTSLLSILNRLDYKKYDVDLLLNNNSGELLNQIPSEVNLLEQARKFSDNRKEWFHRMFNIKYLLNYIISKLISIYTRIPLQGAQYLSSKECVFVYRDIINEYDLAISFLEGPCTKFTAKHINARKKIAWVHINYEDTKLNPKYDLPYYSIFDKIVLVSQDCQDAFNRKFPSLTTKTCFIENILSTEYIKNRGNISINLNINNNFLNIVTICRIAFQSKGLDRVIEAFVKLKNDDKLKNVIWHVIGDGNDLPIFREMIKKNNLSEFIILYGKQTNPIPYLKGMDIFLLPSRFEGKPMAVTEAFMMGVPVVATEYSSAHEQIRDGVDGKIIDNSTEGIYEGIKWLLENRKIIIEWKNNVLKKDYSNTEEMKKVNTLIETMLK